MPLKVGPVNGHTMMLDATSEEDSIWLMCSCGKTQVFSEPSGENLREVIGAITDHLGTPPLDDEEIEAKMAMFDAIFPPEEE